MVKGGEACSWKNSANIHTASDDLAPFGYDKTAIRWLINLDADGNFLGFITTSSGKKNDRGKAFFAPAVMKSVNVKASLLVGNGEYVLGKPRPSPKKDLKPEDLSKRSIEWPNAMKPLSKRCGTVSNLLEVLT